MRRQRSRAPRQKESTTKLHQRCLEISCRADGSHLTFQHLSLSKLSPTHTCAGKHSLPPSLESDSFFLQVMQKYARMTPITSIARIPPLLTTAASKEAMQMKMQCWSWSRIQMAGMKRFYISIRVLLVTQMLSIAIHTTANSGSDGVTHLAKHSLVIRSLLAR